MRIKTTNIDPIKLWSEYCDLLDTQGPFLAPTFCPNPDHNNTNTPAFQINIAQPTVHCFSHCGISGSYFHAIAVIEGIYDKMGITLDDIKNSRKKWEVGESSDIRQSRDKVRRAHNQAFKIIVQKASAMRLADRTSKKSRSTLQGTGVASSLPTPAELEKSLSDYSYLPKDARKYLESRGINASSRQHWQIGFDEEAQRLTIPVRDEQNRVLFIIRRGIHKWQKPAYLYPSESPKSRVLFGACALDRSMVGSQGLIVVEGAMDCMRLHQHGYRNTVAILGNKISDKQKKLIARLRPKRVYLFFDKDAGGVQAIESARSLSQKYAIKVVMYPKGENLDPAKLSAEQVAKALGKAVPLLRMTQKIKKARREAIV